MKTSKKTRNTLPLGVTLIELTVVIAIVLVLTTLSTVSVRAYQNWRAGLQAGEVLKSVYQAQKLFLADNPTRNTVTTPLLAAELIPYLPNNAVAMPTVIDLNGTPHAVNIATVPPTITGYADQTGPGDSLWDAGR